MKRKLTAMFLVLCMVLTVLPVAALAEEANAESAGIPMAELTEAQPKEQTEGEAVAAEEAAAKIGENNFPTLKAAVDAAKPSDTILLLKDQTLNEILKIKTSLTLDGQGHKISGTGRLDIVSCEVTFQNVTISTTAAGASAKYPAVYVWGANAVLNIAADCTVEHTGDNPTIYITEGTLNTSGHIVVKDSTQPAVSSGGRDEKANIVVNGGTIEGPRGILVGQRGTCVINGGTIKGESYAVLGQSGNLDPNVVPVITVKGGELQATDTALRVYAGSATVEGGTLKGPSGMEVHGKDSVGTVTGGKIDAEVPVKTTTEDAKASISGGTFTNKPEDKFFENGKAPAQKPDGSYDVVTVTPEQADAAKKVADMIEKLPAADQIALENETAVNEAKAAYDKLEKKELINNDLTKKLTDALAKLEELKNAAKAVAEMIEKLPTADQLKLENETAVNEANAAFGKLSDAQKKLIDPALVAKLNADVAKMAELKQNETDKQAAKRVEDQINALPNLFKISLRDKADVQAARYAYNALTDAQKALVSRQAVDKLIASERAIAWLESTTATSNITVRNSLHGWVSVNRTYASKGDLVTITVHPDKDYKLDWLTVKDYLGNKISVTGINDVYTFIMPDTSVTVEAGFKAVYQTDFRDVSYTDYYYDAVQWAVSKGITTGISNDYFAPDRTCTRAEAVTFLWRAAGSPRPVYTTNNFNDVSYNAFYYDAVQWAVGEGIVKGTGENTFSPDAVCDRGQIVTLLWRANGSRTVYSTNPFRDVAAGDYFYDAVQWAVWNNITTGVASDTFAPGASCTRAQIVTFLYRSAT